MQWKGYCLMDLEVGLTEHLRVEFVVELMIYSVALDYFKGRKLAGRKCHGDSLSRQKSHNFRPAISSGYISSGYILFSDLLQYFVLATFCLFEKVIFPLIFSCKYDNGIFCALHSHFCSQFGNFCFWNCGNKLPIFFN